MFHLSPSCGTPSQIVHAQRRIISDSIEAHRRYQKHSYSFSSNDGENIDDYYYVDGERELSDAWTGFTRFFLLNGRRADGFYMVWGRLTRKQTTSRPDNVWPDMWKYMLGTSKRKAQQKMITRNQSSIMPEDNVVSSSLKLMMKNSNVP